MANPRPFLCSEANMVDPLALVPDKAVVFIDAMSLYQGLLLDLLAQHCLHDPAWRGAKVVPIRRVGAGE